MTRGRGEACFRLVVVESCHGTDGFGMGVTRACDLSREPTLVSRIMGDGWIEVAVPRDESDVSVPKARAGGRSYF